MRPGSPPSTTPDPGWCGDPKRGASMGRGSHGSSPETVIHYGLVHLDEGGYDPGGSYWGIGKPVFEAYAEGFYRTVRAADHDEALAIFQKMEPGAVFERREVIAEDVQAFTEAYFRALVWSCGDNAVCDLDVRLVDLCKETRTVIESDCAKFFQENVVDISSSPAQAGHDFALTRNHHGAGFWDGDWPKEAGERLTKASYAFGECNLYLGGDGIFYIE